MWYLWEQIYLLVMKVHPMTDKYGTHGLMKALLKRGVFKKLEHIIGKFL